MARVFGTEEQAEKDIVAIDVRAVHIIVELVQVGRDGLRDERGQRDQ